MTGDRQFFHALNIDFYLTLVFQLSALNAHNLNRRTHGVSSLVLDADMSGEATDYARKIAKDGNLEHSGTNDGENIASVCRSKNLLMTGLEATTIW